ncbi:hypothetical protein BC628DRAFT_1413984 [Trametes gibbosa]|nr:hypothetical protein BC628DRAFT_1413984 [Trametes gibbosa]
MAPKGFAGLYRTHKNAPPRRYTVDASPPASPPPVPVSPPPPPPRQVDPEPEPQPPTSNAHPHPDDPGNNMSDSSPAKKKKKLYAYDSKMIKKYYALVPGTKQATRIAEGTEFLYQAAQDFPRHLGAFIDYDNVLREGLARDGTWSTDDPEQQEDPLTWGPYWDAKCGFATLKDLFSGLEDAIPYLRRHPELASQMAKWMKSVTSKARSDDANRLKDHIVEILGLPDEVKDKVQRGFRHHVTGRLLCPPHLLDEFDNDPERFCCSIYNMRRGRPQVGSVNYPMFMYNMDEYVPGKRKPGLLKSELLITCARLIFQGPTAAKNGGTQITTKGRPSVASSINMKELDGFTIVYIATLTRFALNSQHQWYNDDGDFIGSEFYNNLMSIFLQDDDWSEEIQLWYREQLFGRAASTNSARPGPSGHDLLLAEIAAEKAEKAAKAKALAAANAAADADAESE